MKLKGMVHIGMTVVAAGWIAAVPSLALDAVDWPQFRGPDRDGISKDTRWNPGALNKGATILWTAKVGNGYSAVSVLGDRVFTAGNEGNKDTIFALSSKDGKVLWKYSYPCQGGSYPGPRATPATDGKVVYFMSREGLVLCLDAGTGEVKWKKSVMTEFGAENLGWGLSGSPVIEGDKLLLNAGEYGIVLNRNTGVKIWASPAGTGGYAAPVVFNNGKTRCLAVFSQKELAVVELATGRKLGAFPWETSYDVNASDPVAHDGRIFIASGYGKGCAVIDAREAPLKQVWVNKAMRSQFSSCVLIDGFLYGIDGNYGNGTLKCLEFATGQVKWEEQLGFGALTAVGGNLVMINEDGDVFVVKASPNGYALVSSAKKVLKKTCWTSPVVCRGILYCRNEKGHLVAVDVRK